MKDLKELKETINSFNNAKFLNYNFDFATGAETIKFKASNFAKQGIERATGLKAERLLNEVYIINLPHF